jgi:hypothetical protein
MKTTRSTLDVAVTVSDLEFRATAVIDAGAVAEVDIERLDESGWVPVQHPTPELVRAVDDAITTKLNEAREWQRSGYNE